MSDQPGPISRAEQRARIRRITEIADGFGFTRDVEYRHVYSRSGGAQYAIGSSPDNDIMVVYAEAFERDADPDDFHLDALIAHECGHQRLHRDLKLRAVLVKFPGEEFEEVLASLVGSILLGESESSLTLSWKAAAELTDLGLTVEYAEHLVKRFVRYLEEAFMMGKKKLSEIKAQLEALSAHLPRKPPKTEPAKGGTKQIVETLEGLCAELERVASKPRKPKARRPVKR